MYTPIITSTGIAAWNFLQETEEQHLTALKADPQVKRDTEHFLSAIGSATTPDELLADRRLLEVALTAFGLESEIDKTAFIKRVLESGPAEDSFANSLSDERWGDFAAAFGYADPNAGDEVTGFQATVELAYRPDGTPDPRADDIADADLAHLRANIGSVNSVEDLLADTRLLDTALKAFDLERGYYTDDHFRRLLTEGLSQGSYATQQQDTAWISFTRAFTGLDDGTGEQSFHALETAALREFWRLDRPPASSQSVADADPNRVSDTEYGVFTDVLETAATADDALANDTVLKVALAAFGLGVDATPPAEARAILSAAAGGDLSLAQAKTDPAWTRAAEAFQEAFAGGTPQFDRNAEYRLEIAIASRELETLSYMPVPDNGALTIDPAELTYFQETMPTIESAAAFVADERLRDVAFQVFGLEGETISDEELQEILEQDPTDPLATVNRFGDNPGWQRMAEAWQGGAEAESARWRYELEDRLTTLGAPQADIDYLRRNWDLVNEGLDILVDPRLLDIVLSAFELSDDVGPAFVTRILIDDPNDRNSFVQRIDDPRWNAFADLFTSRATGNVQSDEFQQTLIDDYHDALLRIQVGTQNENLRIAMFFESEIGEVANMERVSEIGWQTIMGSEPMRRVMDAAFGLPQEFVQLDIEAQLPVYERRAQAIFGGDDPSVFLDPANINKAIELFMVRRDTVAPAQSGAQSAVTLMGQALSLAQNAVTAEDLVRSIVNRRA